MTYSEKCRAVESLLGAKTCVSYMKGDTLDRILTLAAKAEAGEKLRAAIIEHSPLTSQVKVTDVRGYAATRERSE